MMPPSRDCKSYQLSVRREHELTTTRSAVALGYLDDPYAALLHRGARVRKAPLINVGTHHRTYALDAVADSFLAAAGPDAQVVSLGAGSDTRFWRLMVRCCMP